MGWDAVDDAGGGFGVNKPAGQNRKLEFCNGVFEGFAYEFCAFEAAFDCDFFLLFFEFFSGFLANNPGFAVDVCFHVGGVRVNPHVSDAVDGFGAESRRRQNRAVGQFVLD